MTLEGEKLQMVADAHAELLKERQMTCEHEYNIAPVWQLACQKCGAPLPAKKGCNEAMTTETTTCAEPGCGYAVEEVGLCSLHAAVSRGGSDADSPLLGNAPVCSCSCHAGYPPAGGCDCRKAERPPCNADGTLPEAPPRRAGVEDAALEMAEALLAGSVNVLTNMLDEAVDSILSAQRGTPPVDALVPDSGALVEALVEALAEVAGSSGLVSIGSAKLLRPYFAHVLDAHLDALVPEAPPRRAGVEKLAEEIDSAIFDHSGAGITKAGSIAAIAHVLDAHLDALVPDSGAQREADVRLAKYLSMKLREHVVPLDDLPHHIANWIGDMAEAEA